MTQLPAPLPANRAFVVQFRAQHSGESPRCEGRVEHLESGQASRFTSWEALWTFISGVLSEMQDNPPTR